MSTCDDKLGKESSRSKRALEHVLEKLYRWLPLLLWALLSVLVLALRLAYVRGFPSELGVGIVLGMVDVLLMLLAMMQVYVALAVQVVVVS